MNSATDDTGAAATPTARAMRIAAIYALFGVLWIALSDRLLAAVAIDAADLTRLQTYKGWGYVGVTAALVFHLGRRTLQRQQRLIDELRRREAQLQALNAELERRVAQRTAELEAAYRELEGFSYSVSHDLKAPLRGIDGYSQIMLEDYSDKLDVAGSRYLRKIRQGVDHMHHLIDDVLAYSRMERRPIDIRRVDLATFVRSVLAERAVELEERKVGVSVELPDVTVRADIDGLAIILRNLLGNALKFSAAVAAPSIEIGAREEAGKTVVWVRDNGIGFDMQFHDRIFELFTRLERAETYAGTGAGLALVKKTVARMGGRVWAEAAPGQGASFYVELPA